MKVHPPHPMTVFKTRHVFAFKQRRRWQRWILQPNLASFFVCMMPLFVTYFLARNILGAFLLVGSRRYLTSTDETDLHPLHINTLSGEETTTTTAIFYNVYTPSHEDIERVTTIFEEQYVHLEQLHHQKRSKNHEYKLYIRSIGVPLSETLGNITSKRSIETTLLRHDKKGDEKETLGLLWEYCQDHPNDNVIYLHSKGSFHPSQQNEAMRKFLTIGATSKECATAMNNARSTNTRNNNYMTCNVCASRISPLPHPHVPGNMWSAKCGYIQNLLDPRIFDKAMNRIDYNTTNKYFAKAAPSCLGKRRYAAEHWALSHPTVMPCDLSDDITYLFNYEGIPSVHDFQDHMDLQPAPRFPLCDFVDRRWDFVVYCKQMKDDLNNPQIRLREYALLYGGSDDAIPPKSWFGWDYYNYDVNKVFDNKMNNTLKQT